MSPFAFEIELTTVEAPWQFLHVKVGLHSIDRDLAGNLTGLVSTHSVSDDVDAVNRQKVVFVLGPDLASMGR